MLLSDFDFELPAAQIAQTPLAQRDASRLMVLGEGAPAHRSVRDLPELLRPGDLLVVNDSRVLPARLLGRKRDSGGKAELLLVTPEVGSVHQAMTAPAHGSCWRCLGQASKGLRAGTWLIFDGGLCAEVLERNEEGTLRVRFDAPGHIVLGEALEQAGKMPLPPYIARDTSAADSERYQTIYARTPGSVAAPTAGLHFTEQLFTALEQRGVERASVTLDVGPGTFAPVRDLSQHQMHRERYDVPADLPARIAATRARKGRVVAVGTTVTRVLESATDAHGELRAGPGDTALFIQPGYAFAQVDVLMTNFHLPRSTLLMLVCAFAGQERVLSAYGEAVRSGYRFYSYGDAMLAFRKEDA